MIRVQIFNSDSSRLYKAVVQNEKKVIGTKHSLGKANLSSSTITPEGQNIPILLML